MQAVQVPEFDLVPALGNPCIAKMVWKNKRQSKEPTSLCADNRRSDRRQKSRMTER